MYGLRGGTAAALKLATEKVLQGTKTLQIVVNPDSNGVQYAGENLWQIQLLTLVAETPDVDTAGGYSRTVLNAIRDTIPAGFHVIHYAVDDLEAFEPVTYDGNGIYGSILSY